MVEDFYKFDNFREESETWYDLRRINSIRNLLSVDAVKTLVCSLVLSHFDYCHSLLDGLPLYHIKRLQGVQNSAARSILRTPRSEHISPLLQNLHWLPVHKGILHTVVALCHTTLSGLTLKTCLTLLMFIPLLDPCAFPQILSS